MLRLFLKLRCPFAALAWSKKTRPQAVTLTNKQTNTKSDTRHGTLLKVPPQRPRAPKSLAKSLTASTMRTLTGPPSDHATGSGAVPLPTQFTTIPDTATQALPTSVTSSLCLLLLFHRVHSSPTPLFLSSLWITESALLELCSRVSRVFRCSQVSACTSPLHSCRLALLWSLLRSALRVVVNHVYTMSLIFFPSKKAVIKSASLLVAGMFPNRCFSPEEFTLHPQPPYVHVSNLPCTQP